MTKTTKETEQENAIFVQANIFLIIKLLLKIYKSTKYIFKKNFFMLLINTARNLK